MEGKSSNQDNVIPKKNTRENYQVGVMYDQYYVRKREIAENVLMIAICDVQCDGGEECVVPLGK